MKAIKRRSRVLGPLVVLALIIAACGGDTDDTTTTAGEATTTAAEATTTVAAETTTSAGETTTLGRSGGRGGGDHRRRLDHGTFLPKCTNIAVFPQANSGAEEAAAELGSDPAEFVGPADCGDATGQIEFMTNAVTQGVHAIMLSNNSGDQLDAPAAGGGRCRHPGRDLGLADPFGHGRERVRGPGRLRRDRSGDGRHGPQHPRGRRWAVRHPVGDPGRRQPERLDRGHGGSAGRSGLRQSRIGRDRLRQ